MSWTPRTLREFLAASVAARGGADAVVAEHVRLSWPELETAAWRAAKALHALGLQRGDHVGVLMGNDEKWLETFYGAALVGAVTVPVNTRFKAAELAFCLKQADCKALVLADRFMKIEFVSFLREAEPAVDAQLPGHRLPLLRHVVVVGEEVPRAAVGWTTFLAAGDSVSDQTIRDAAGAVKPDNPLLIQFTSGTTAYPKGVVLTHDNMLRNAWAAGSRIGVGADDRYFNCRPFFHVAGSTLSALMALVFGACLVTLPTFEAGAALALMARERCTLISGNDTLFQLLMSHADFDRSTLSLRGGWAAAGPETMRRIVDVLGARAICAAYGLSEASPNVVMSDHRDSLELRIAGLAQPHEGVAVRIVDPDTLAALPPETPGEIQVRGWNVMRGYYNSPEANAKVFTPDGWLRTGDLGSLTADNRLRMSGRLKDVFRVGGENVAPAEVEEVLLSHPAVASAQVIGVPDARLGEVPAAYVTLRAGAVATADELLGFMKARCANFRVPRYLRIVPDFEAIGMTASGKVQKTKLREHAVRELGLDREPG
ncbi:MAG TPA: AMP-binding protein [Burkholderiales bacterium]|nr:AMP-binding protein [Burkholderiales bacterium]